MQLTSNRHDVEGALLDRIDFIRLDATRRLDQEHRSDMGQFLTPAPIAKLMASMFSGGRRSIRLLDAGAGVGSLSAAFVAEVCQAEMRPQKLSIVAYELDPVLIECLEETLEACRLECSRVGIEFVAEVLQDDFIEAGVSILEDLFSPHAQESFDCAILNPPYHKIRSDSNERKLLERAGIETSNLYAAFVSIVLKLLRPGGELVAITPRSFCNGPYFKPFRRLLLEMMTVRRIHLFEHRNRAFRDDKVLQENLILHAIKERLIDGKVTISSSEQPDDPHPAIRNADYAELVHPNDRDCFIHIAPDELNHRIVERASLFTSTLEDFGIAVSTGRVVDFRATDFLRQGPEKGTVPLIYPGHLESGFVKWPRPGSKKPNALRRAPETESLLLPAGTYVVVKRFSAKEERRRIVAAVYDAARVSKLPVAFENHLNVYHKDGQGLPMPFAKGLAVFLNSTLIDVSFRQFNGHTQVNATDLRSLKYPSREQLEALGSKIGDTVPAQDEIDGLIEKELVGMADDPHAQDPVLAKKRIDEALTVLKDLGLPREQQNERSALTLLALLAMGPSTRWTEATDPPRGITQMMDFFTEQFGKKYAPNTRETVRRFTVHQFVQAGLVIQNPDDPTRPTNSPNNVYQIAPSVLDLLRTYGTAKWRDQLKLHLTSVETLTKRYDRERSMTRIPVRVAPGKTISLSAGGQNVLVKEIINEFCSRFTPGATVVYVGDTDTKWAHFNLAKLAELGVTVDEHGKMPDVVVYMEDKNWLVLIEAVTSHGPVNPKRRSELEHLFKGTTASLVFVTAFLDRKTLVKYLRDIAWETEVWVAEAPTHMIHFNGERFLGPHDD